MEFKWVNDFNRNQIEQIHSMMKNEWWCSNRSLSDVVRVIDGSDFLLGAVNENESVVGFARVLTDFIYKAVIFDVIVLPSLRNTGLGKEIIRNLLDSNKLKDVKSFELYCPERISGFYRKLGFAECESKFMAYEGQN